MQDVSERFRAAAREAPQVVSYVDVHHSGELVATLDITSGQIQIDAAATVRRTLQLDAIDRNGDLVPGSSDASDALEPTRAELHVRSGFRYPDGEEETVPCGVFRPRRLEISEADGALTISTDGFDRSRSCQSPLRKAWAIPGGQAVENEIARLLTGVLPSLTMHSYDTGFTTPPLLLAEGADPWAEAASLATAAGCELSIDREGQGVLEPVAVSASQADVPEFIEGAGAERFWNPSRELSIDELANVVVVVGSHSSTAGIRAEVGDEDPTSPTFRHGPFGEQVIIERSERVSTATQAQAMANGLLVKNLGPSETIAFETGPNAALDPGDTISLTRERLGLLDRRLIVEGITFPLTVDTPMIVAARRSILTGVQTPELEG